MSIKRLNRELRDLQSRDLPYSLRPKTDGDLSIWLAKVPGPEGTSYSELVYEIEITIPMESYPFKAPVLVFVTPIMHPNIENGKACLLSTREWSPEKRIADVVDEIISLLKNPRWNERLVMEPLDPSEFMLQAKRHASSAKHNCNF